MDTPARHRVCWVPPVTSIRKGTVEHTHEYDCIACGAHFDDSKSLSRHNEEKHLKNATGMERPRSEDKSDTDSGREQRS